MQTFTITSKNFSTPVTFNSNLDDSQVATALWSLKGNFARSLATTSHWSEKQRAWAHYLVAGSPSPEAPKAAQAPKAAPQNFSGIVHLFEHAAESLKYPRVTFATDAGTVRIQRAGNMSRYAGDLMVTDGQGYGQNKFYGRIDQAGNFHAGRDASSQVTTVLAEINADPGEALGRLGLANGTCCFCGRDLTAEDSTVWGYGPVCAKNWGLPHGAEKIQIKD